MSEISTRFLLTRRNDPHARDTLLRRHIGLAHTIASEYFAPGLEHDDLYATALAAADQAITAFNGGDLGAFVGLVMRRQIITRVIAAKRGKHGPGNYATSLDTPIADDDSMTLGDTLAGPDEPHSIVAARETQREILATLQRCSVLERKAVALQMLGCDYAEIAAAIGLGEKAVDNALQRGRRRLRAIAA